MNDTAHDANKVSRNLWLSAVQEAESAPLPESDALTLREFSELMGTDRTAASRRMRLLVAIGKAEQTRKRIRRGDGVVITVPAFRLVQ